MRASSFGQFKLYWAASLFLDNACTFSNPVHCLNITNLQTYEVTRP
jgi:hypothetical protein